MMLWLIFTLMTAAAIFAVLWPLARRTSAKSGSDVAVYRDQLDEISRDRAAGLIGEAEAEAARVEVSRRLISAADAADAELPPAPGSLLWRRRLTAAAALLAIPVGAVGLYAMIGSPQLPGEPLEARMRAIQNDRSISGLVAQVEAHLAHNPNDARGFAVLAPVYLQLGRFSDAVKARRKVLELSGESAERQSDLGEALVAEANGIVADDAKRAFARALALDPGEAKAQFYLGLAAEQDGNRTKAAEIWRGLLKNSPNDAPWLATVREALARIGAEVPPVASAPGPGPSAADVAAASQMNEQDRNAMVQGMVARLADRLKQNGNDIEGWQRLLRAYMVLNDRAKAYAAAADARKALASDPEKLRQIEDTIKSLGIGS